MEIFAQFVHQVIDLQPLSSEEEKKEQATVIVDAGSGKGYLSSRLVLEYKYHVLGIDCNHLNSENALKRGHKLQVIIIKHIH